MEPKILTFWLRPCWPCCWSPPWHWLSLGGCCPSPTSLHSSSNPSTSSVASSAHSMSSSCSWLLTLISILETTFHHWYLFIPLFKYFSYLFLFFQVFLISMASFVWVFPILLWVSTCHPTLLIIQVSCCTCCTLSVLSTLLYHALGHVRYDGAGGGGGGGQHLLVNLFPDSAGDRVKLLPLGVAWFCASCFVLEESIQTLSRHYTLYMVSHYNCGIVVLACPCSFQYKLCFHSWSSY